MASEVTPKMTDKVIIIIGTGDYARALAKRALSSGYSVICGSRYPEKRHLAAIDRTLEDVKVVTIFQSIQAADVIFLCVNVEAHKELLNYHKDDLKKKIIVDVSNPAKKRSGSSIAEDVQHYLPDSSVVKALNTISAYELESDVHTNDKDVLVCGDDPEAKSRVEAIIQDLGFRVANFGGLRQARHLEELPAQLFKGWGAASVIASVVTFIWAVFAIIRVHVVDKRSWGDLPLFTLNKIFGCNAVTLLSLCFLPGCIAAFIQMSNGTKYRRFPNWMDRWLKARKQLGLFALLSAVLHVIFSLIVLQPGYHPRLFSNYHITIPENASVGQQILVTPTITARGGGAIVAGVFSLAAMVVLGITSIPAIGKLLNWSEWRFIQSHLGWFGLILAGTHPSVLNQWSIVITTSLFCLFLPYITLGFKIIITMPCVHTYLWKIRRGYEKGSGSDPENRVRSNGKYRKSSPRVSASPREGRLSASYNSNSHIVNTN
jgi:predicted dinucleotide-binding enzyme/DMSO/TMAO reductase YedYZ heme-binding membrane subunit